MSLSDDQRRYLTELIGECWEEKTIYYEGCCEPHGYIDRRTFLEPADFFAVCRALSQGELSSILNNRTKTNTIYYLAGLLQQPTFIEDFMREVAKQGGITE